MKITCPKCHFEKEINLAAIPTSATSATCPKCKEKFAFREPLPDYSHIKPKGIIVDDSQEKAQLEAEIYNQEERLSRQNESLEKQKEQRNQEEKKTVLEKPVLTTSKADKQDLREEDIKKPEHMSHMSDQEFKQYVHNEYRKQSEQSKHGQEAGQNFLTMVPWELQGTELNIFAKFFQTVTRVLFSSPAFFATMFRPFPISKAVLFYILIGVLQFLARMLFFQYSTMPGLENVDPQTMAVLEVMQEPSTLILGLCVAPFILILQLMTLSGILFGIIKLVEPKSADFSLITRMIAYAAAPGIFSLIPVLGDFIALPWVVFNVLIACRFALKMSFSKVLLTFCAFCIFTTFVILVFFNQYLGIL